MAGESNIEKLVNVKAWCEENRENFKPPVCNAIMAGGFLKIMFVGGPNTRKDYHLDKGEELFYMLKGDMCLKVMLNGQPKDIIIKEGEVFLLPSCIPHSPQRSPNTLGLVLERDRCDVHDGIRYYCEDGTTVLWQKFFHLRSLVDNLLPIIKEYFASEQYKTGIPKLGTTDTDPSIFVEDTSTVPKPPQSLDKLLEESLFCEPQQKFVHLFDSVEFRMTAYSEGSFEIQNKNESWIWLKKGNASMDLNGENKKLVEEDSIIVKQNNRFMLNVSGNGSYCLVFTNQATPPSNP